MRVKFAFDGFKKPSEFFNEHDLISVLVLFLTTGIAVALLFPKTIKKLRSFFAVLSLIAALPLLIKGIAAVVSSLTGSNKSYSQQIID